MLTEDLATRLLHARGFTVTTRNVRLADAAVQRYAISEFGGYLKTVGESGYVTIRRAGRGFRVRKVQGGYGADAYHDVLWPSDKVSTIVRVIQGELPEWLKLDYDGHPMVGFPGRDNFRRIDNWDFHRMPNPVYMDDWMMGLNIMVRRGRRSYIKIADYEDKRPRKPVRSGGGNLDEFLDKHRANAVSHEVIPLMPEPPEGLLASRRWGIEIEAAGARGVEAPTGWSRKSDGSLRSAYDSDYTTEPVPNETVLQHNSEGVHNRQDYNFITGRYEANPNYIGLGSECIECSTYEREYNEWADRVDEGDDYEDTAEFVSPILYTAHSKGLRTLLDDLIMEPQNDSAGVHVHVEVADLTPRQIGSLLYGYNLIEPLIERSYRRSVREYCRPWSSSGLRTSILTAKKVRENQMINGYERYVTLNLTSIGQHGTVEFRAMGPVYEYDYLIRWATFCREMVNLAKAGVRPKEWHAVKTFDQLKSLFIRKGVELVGFEFGEIQPTLPFPLRDMYARQKLEFENTMGRAKFNDLVEAERRRELEADPEDNTTTETSDETVPDTRVPQAHSGGIYTASAGGGGASDIRTTIDWTELFGSITPTVRAAQEMSEALREANERIG